MAFCVWVLRVEEEGGRDEFSFRRARSLARRRFFLSLSFSFSFFSCSSCDKTQFSPWRTFQPRFQRPKERTKERTERESLLVRKLRHVASFETGEMLQRQVNFSPLQKAVFRAQACQFLYRDAYPYFLGSKLEVKEDFTGETSAISNAFFYRFRRKNETKKKFDALS